MDLSTIPPPLSQPGSIGLDTSGSELVFFDLETTGLDRTAHVIQIAASHNHNQFSAFVIPKKKISTKAADVTGVSMVGETMIVKGKEVEAIYIRNAIEKFIEFLKTCQNNRKLILAGHNIESFDCKVLLNLLKNCGKLTDFKNNVTGFMDTMKLFKKIVPGMSSYRQEYLFNELLGETYTAHSALEDAIALQKLYHSLRTETTAINLCAFSFAYAEKAFNISCEVKLNLPSLQKMIEEKVVSVGLARTIAGSGLNLNHLIIVWKRDGADGLRHLLSEVHEGHIRVTKSDKIITAITNYISQLN